MKKVVLILAVFLYTGVYANPMSGSWHRISEPVKVKERGINFYIFPNGDFDFNAHGNHYRHAGYRGVRVERDRFGKIRRVGNVYIDYNRHGQVSRIGHVFIKYNHRGLVAKIGHRYLRYNRRGYYVFRHHSSHHPAFVTNFGYYGPACNIPPVYTADLSNDFDYNEDIYYDDYEADYYYRPNHEKSNKPVVKSNSRRR